MTDQLQKMSNEELLIGIEREAVYAQIYWDSDDEADGLEAFAIETVIEEYKAELLRRLEAGARLAVAAERLITLLDEERIKTETLPNGSVYLSEGENDLQIAYGLQKAALADYRKAG